MMILISLHSKFSRVRYTRTNNYFNTKRSDKIMQKENGAVIRSTYSLQWKSLSKDM